MNKRFVTEMLGWYGVAAILLAYAGVSFGLLNSASNLYQVLNLTGALGVLVDALSQKNFQPAVLNLVWATVALVSLVNSFL